jgi:two-component system response regulator RegX3
MRIPIMAARSHELDLYAQWLATAGHSVDTFSHTRELFGALSCSQFDAVVLDADGVEITDWSLMRQVRLLTSIPALFVSSDGTEDGVVNTLKAGADDYLPKPARREELLARLEAITRQRERTKNGALETDGIRVDFHNRTISLDHIQAKLTGKDFDLAALFLLNMGQLMSRSYIAHTIWGQEPDSIASTLNTYICRLRRALSLTPRYGWRLTPIYGRGYRLEKCMPSPPGTKPAVTTSERL